MARRQPLKNKGRTPRSQTTTVKSLSAPVGGWNARDSIANMGVHDAVYLNNWFPTTTDCELRGGHSDHCHTITGTVETLAVYNDEDGSAKMFAVTDTDCYNVSSAGAGAAQSWVDQSNGKYQSVMMSDGTTNWLLMFNGDDEPKYYNGSTWVEVDATSTPAITGVTSSALIQATVYNQRVYAVQKATLSAWYLPADSVGGAATEFKLDFIADKGGYLMWVDTWTFEGGDGLDDYICFMTSEGQAIVYKGLYPGDASWELVGVYNLIGKPLGRRSHIRYEGDLLVLLEGGVFPMGLALKSSAGDPTIAVTDKINSAYTTAARSYGTNFGWEMIIHPLQNAMLVNIPVNEVTGQKQYVMNTITKSWCSFDSWYAQCFAVFNGELYFGGSTVVQKAWDGTSDDGNEIIAEGRTSFNYFDDVGGLKRVNMFRPTLRVNGNISFLVGLDADFSTEDITGVSSYSVSVASSWDTGTWDSAIWDSALDVVKQWTSPNNNVGYCISGKIKVNSDSLEIHWLSNDYLIELGGIL